MKGFHTNFERILSIIISWAGFARIFYGVSANAQELTVLWDRVGDGDLSYFGGIVSPLGDQNDDGFADWTVMSVGRGPAGQPSETKLSFFHGGENPSLTPYLELTRGPDAPEEPFAPYVTGDLNDDGFKDWYRLIRYAATPDSTNVEVYFGGPDADLIPELFFRIPVSSTNVNPNRGESFDFNGDGFDDLLVYIQITDGDYAYVLLGGDPMDAQPDLVFYGNPQGSQSTLPRTTGDINGDGYSDFLTRRGAVDTTFIYLGSEVPDTVADIAWGNFPIGWSPILCDMTADARDDLIVPRSVRLEVTLGREAPVNVIDYGLDYNDCNTGIKEVAPAGDFNDDGYRDLLSYLADCNNGYGTLSLYLGGSWLNPDPVLTIDGLAQPLALRGITSAAGLGDINGDGIDDFVIGAAADMTGARRGRVVIISGDTTYHVGVEHETPIMPSEFALSVFPNPVNSVATIQLETPIGFSNTDVALYNTLGQTVVHSQVSVSPGTNMVSLSVADLSSGVYFLKAECGNASQLRKMVVMK